MDSAAAAAELETESVTLIIRRPVFIIDENGDIFLVGEDSFDAVTNQWPSSWFASV